MSDNIVTLFQEIYADGSGSSGLYEVAGVTLSGIWNGVTASVNALDVPHVYVPRHRWLALGTQETVHEASRMLREHLAAVNDPNRRAWA